MIVIDRESGRVLEGCYSIHVKNSFKNLNSLAIFEEVRKLKKCSNIINEQN